jgi:succinate dehydrogenase hydrophobic anchor subunit
MEKTLNRNLTETTWLWIVKVVAGLLIILWLGLHFIVNHFLAPNGLLSYDEVVRYYKNPIIPAIEILFLVTVVTHAFVGLRSILLDLNPSRAIQRVIDWVLILIGAGAIIYGTWLVLLIASK